MAYAGEQEAVWLLDEYEDILTADEACEALRIGHNALYALLNSGKGTAMAAYGGFPRLPSEITSLLASEQKNKGDRFNIKVSGRLG